MRLQPRSAIGHFCDPAKRSLAVAAQNDLTEPRPQGSGVQLRCGPSNPAEALMSTPPSILVPMKWIAAALLLCATAFGAAGIDLSGAWSGTIEVNDSSTPV